MTKQEDIREGLHKALQGDNSTVVGEPCPYCRDTEMALSYLHSQGVVIKADREWDIGETDAHGTVCNPICHNMERTLLKEAGYVAVEPLIEE